MKLESTIIEGGAIDQFRPGQIHQHAFVFASRVATVLRANSQLLLHFFVEVFQQYLACLDHCFADLAGEV